MKNTLFTIILLALVPASLYPISAFDITETQDRYQKSQWWSGKNLAEGDYFVYEICNFESFTKSTLSGHCYDISLEFVALLQTDTGNKWVVQAQIITIDEEKKFAIFLIDDTTFDITTDRTALEYADSVQNTIFYMEEFADSQSKKHLKIGKNWGDVSSYVTPDPQMTVREKSLFTVNGEQVPVFEVGYVILEHTSFQINNKIPFPLSATAYDSHRIIPSTPKLFEFNLLAHDNANDHNFKGGQFDGNEIDSLKQETLDYELQSIIGSLESKLGSQP